MKKVIKITVMVFGLLGIGLVSVFGVYCGYNTIKTKAITDFIAECEYSPVGFTRKDEGFTKYINRYGIEKVRYSVNKDGETILTMTKEED